MLSPDSDEDMEEPGSSDDEEMEEISMSPVPDSAPLPPESSSPVRSTVQTPPQSSSPRSGSPTHTTNHKRKSTESFGSGSIHRMSKTSRQNSRKTLSSSTKISLPLGERLKKRFLDLNVLSTLLVSNGLRRPRVRGLTRGFDRIYFSSSRGIISFTAWFMT
jgi:serine/threonine-protein phosphatase 6 regulatory subunit 3